MGTWDSDDFPIVVDSATSRTITPVFSDLIDPKPHRSTLQGIRTGTITRWACSLARHPVTDLNGNLTFIEDPEAYFCPGTPYCMLCPHSRRESLNQSCYAAGDTEGEGTTMCLAPVDQGGYLLSWNQGKTVVKAHLDPNVNLPVIRGRPTYANFSTFAAAFQCYPAVATDDDEEVSDEEVIPGNSESTSKRIQFAPSTNPPAPEFISPTKTEEALFLTWHIKLGHAPAVSEHPIGSKTGNFTG